MQTDREFAVDVVRRLATAGYIAFWAGGCVRDELLGLTPADYDVATNADPKQVMGLFRRTIAIGASFGVIEVIGPRKADGSHHTVQVATFRSDGTYLDGRRPEQVVYSSPEEDAQRRDFTINGLFYDPLQDKIWDYVGGQQDLQAKIIRAIGDPFARFEEDKLRLMRAVRMANRFGFPIEANTEQAIHQLATKLPVVSAERIADELKKMLTHPNRATAIRQLHELGLLKAILPDVDRPFAASPPLLEEVFGVLSRLPTEASFPLALAGLLHPFDSKLLVQSCRRLKLSNEEQARAEWLIKHFQLLKTVENLPNHVRYPLLIQPGITELMTLQRALNWSTTAIETMLTETPPEVLNPPLLLTGEDLTARGYQPGPLYKTILQTVRAAQLDGQIHSTAEAFAIAEQLSQRQP